MAAYLIENKTEDEGSKHEVDGATVERLTGVEICYVDWSVDQEGCFENAEWMVSKNLEEG